VRRACHLLVGILCLALRVEEVYSQSLENVQLSGNVSGEYRHFVDPGSRPGLASNNVSFSTEPELYYPLENSRDSVRFTAFYRWDENDKERTHGDIRELKWHKVSRDWELTVGFDRVFWGVTETVHLVNIINQIDFVEDVDGEDFLGQPMIDLTLIRDWGTIDLFILPYFRERTFPGPDGRPPSGVLVSSGTAIYESSAEQWHTDFAVRWANSIGDWDIGAYHFYGTTREPLLDQAVFEINGNGEPELIPIYDIIHQTGLDIQGTFDAWLLKLEAINRSGQDGSFFASALGFEYTFFDIAGFGYDIGIVTEYLHDARDVIISTDDDISLGVRLTLNDISSTDLLAAVVHDLNNDSRYFFVEASRRLGDAFKLSVEVRGVSNVAEDDPLIVFEDDNYIQLELGYFF
jgi:hypothetical protein